MEGSPDLINKIEMKAVEEHKEGTQMYELERIDREILKLRNEMLQKINSINDDSIEEVSSYLKIYELEDMILSRVKEKMNLIDVFDKKYINQNNNAIKVENISFDRDLKDYGTVVSKIDKLKSEIISIKEKTVKTVVDKDSQQQMIKRRKEEIDDLLKLN